MKFSCLSLIFPSLIVPLAAQDSSPKWDVEIPAQIQQNDSPQPLPEAEPINFKVLTTRTKRVEVTEAPPMAELPPIKGTINMTVQVVENPGLSDPPPPLPVLPPSDAAVVARLQELREKYRGTELVFVSATVTDHRRTLVRIYPNGQTDGEITAYSNIDFNHFSGGSGIYRVKEEDDSFHDVGLLMGLGNENSSRMREVAERRGGVENEPTLPEVPDLEESGPAFVLVSGSPNSPAIDTLEQLHDLYRSSGDRLKTDFLAREKAYAERKDYLLKNPPKPDDVVIQFWDRSKGNQPAKGN